MLRHVDLCSGIGGFALGFQWAGLSVPVMFCDNDMFCQQVLAKHWPNVPISGDVEELSIAPNRFVPDCDIITAGYPCQPFSLAGKRKGGADDRHIWPFILEIVAQKRPAWCVFENVYGHVNLGLDKVLFDLEAQNYASRTFIVPACGVDAPHRRDRVWIIANRVNDVENARHRRGRNERSAEKRQDAPRERSADTSQAGRSSEQPASLAYAHNAGCEEQWRSISAPQEHKASKCRGRWEPEPRICRVAHGIPRRVDRLKSLGNAIVPQIAQQIGETIKEIHYGDHPRT